MQTFGYLLKEYIQKQGFTVYQMAKESGIDRSFLQGVLSNKRKLPQKRFTDIINTRFFTANQVHDLCNAYYLQKFGEDKMNRLNNIEYGLTGEYKKDLNGAAKLRPIQIKTNKFYSGRETVLAVISEILKSDAINNFYSNFLFSDKEINSIVYNACKRNRFKNFIHSVTENNGTDCNNIEILFNALHYAEIGYNTYISSENLFSCFFPYFILTDEYFLQFNNCANYAQLISTDSVKPLMTDLLEKIKQDSTKSTIITENAFDYMAKLEIISVNNNHTILGLDNSFCPGVITPEIIEEIATAAIKNIPNVIKQLSTHYQLIMNENAVKKLVVTYQSIERFIQTGIIEQFPKEYANPVPKDMRATMLKILIDRGELQITNPCFFKSSYNFNYQINNKRLIIATCNDINETGAYIGQVIYTTEDEIIVNDFIDYIHYLSTSEKTYSVSLTKELFRSFIATLQE